MEQTAQTNLQGKVRDPLHDTEPDIYQIVARRLFKWTYKGVTRTVGFCLNSPGAGGYCDKEVIWIANDITDPARVVEFTLHESLHAIFPALTEAEVGEAAIGMAELLVGVFTAKGKTLPTMDALGATEQLGRKGAK